MVIKIAKKKIEDIISLNNININIADLLVNAFSYTDLINPDEVEQYIKEGVNEDEAVLRLLCSAFDIDYDLEENEQVMNDYLLSNLKKLNPKEYLDNEYAKKIKTTGKYKKYALKYLTYEPYQLLPYDEINIDNYKENSRIGYFDQSFSYLALTNGNNVWMSLNPNEIETMKPFVNKAKGHVLVLGLGLGYVPFMMALKQEVKSITIIEKDQDIIDLFNNLIAPHFVNKNKIKIIHDDAINYVKKNQRYDYIFADLWHSPEDGLPLFVSLKAINQNIDCWLETSMYALLRRCMITLLEEALLNYQDDSYKFAKTYTDKVINKYYHKTKNLILEKDEDLAKLLSDDNLLKLVID